MVENEIELEILLKGVSSEQREALLRAYANFAEGDPTTAPVQWALFVRLVAEIQKGSWRDINQALADTRKLLEATEEKIAVFEKTNNKHSILLRALITFVGMLIFSVAFMTWKMDQNARPIVDSDFEGALHIDFSRMPTNTLKNRETGIFRVVFEDAKKGGNNE